MLFGLLTYPDSHNLGDEIQSIAARRWLPRVDRLLSREALDRDPDCDKLLLILNGWFLHKPKRWPPHPKIVPIITSFHLSQDKPYGRFGRWHRRVSDVVLRGEGADYLRRHGPIGARDRATLALLQRHGIESFYSGCMTLTLPPHPPKAREEYIAVCDLDDELVDALSRRTRRPLVRTTHHDAVTRDPQARLEKATALLATYARAAAVVTTRLHCALPCLALETPVLFVMPQRQQLRLQPAEELAQHCTYASLAAATDGFDFDAPPANPSGYRALRAALEQRMQDAFSLDAQHRLAREHALRAAHDFRPDAGG